MKTVSSCKGGRSYQINRCIQASSMSYKELRLISSIVSNKYCFNSGSLSDGHHHLSPINYSKTDGSMQEQLNERFSTSQSECSDSRMEC